MALQHLRSSTAHKRPIPTVMSAGQIAVNTNEASPALFFKDSNGDLVKVGPVHIGPDAPNSSPASVAATALVTGTVYQILTVGTSDFTLVGASANTVGTIFTATGTTTGTGTVSGQQGVEKGEQWLDTTGGTYVLKIYDGTAWRSESGTFVDVSGDTMTGALLLDNAASASAPDLSFDGDADTGVYSPGANQVAIATGGNGRVLISNVGLVKVTGGIQVTENVTPTTGSGMEIFKTDSTTGQIQAYDRNVSTWMDLVIKGNTQQFHANGSERMRIDSSGNVGIGQTNPSGRLEVAGGYVTLRNGASSFPDGITAPIIYGSTGGGSGTFDQTGNLVLQSRSDAGNYSICFVTGDTPIERMRITSTGSAQFGGDAEFAGTVDIGGWKASNTTLEGARIYSAGAVQVNRTSGGGAVFVGRLNNSVTSQIIGDGSATFTGSVVTPQLVSKDDTNNTWFYTNNSLNSIPYAWATKNQDANTWNAGVSKDGKFVLGNIGVSSGATITLDGADGSAYFASNVGIGTTSPSASIHLEVSDPQVRLQGTGAYSTSSGPLIQFQGRGPNSTNYNFGKIQAVSSGSNNAGELQFFTNNAGSQSERMRIDSSGRVGIGTSAPSQKLTAVGNIKIAGAQAGNSAKFCLTRTDRSWSINNETDLRFYTGSGDTDSPTTATVVFTGGGNVGIGTSSPDSLLDLEFANSRMRFEQESGSNRPVIRGTRTSDKANRAISIGGSDISFLIGSTATTALTSADEKVRIDSSGRLLVGTSSAPASATTLVLKGNSGSANTQGRIHIQRSGVPGDGDFLGDITFMDTSDGRSGSIGVARDGGTWTAGSSTPGRLVFFTTPSGLNSPTERMRITSDGEMQMGDPSTNGGWRVFVSDQGTAHQRGRMLFRAKSGTASTQEVLQIYNGTSEQLRITANGNIANANNSYGSLSDVKLKENIVDANSQWADIKDLRVRNYNFIEGQTHTQIGLVAQEVELVSPGLVNESPDTDDEGNDLGTVTKSVKYSVLYMKAVKALQEAMERIEVLEQRLSDAGIA